MVRKWMASIIGFAGIVTVLVSVGEFEAAPVKKSGGSSEPPPFSVYYADSISLKLTKAYQEFGLKFQENAIQATRTASFSILRDGVTLETIGRETAKMGEVMKESLERLRPKLEPGEVVDIQFGITRAPPPERDQGQYGQVGFGAELRNSRIFAGAKAYKEYEEKVNESTLEIIRGENQYFTPRRSEYGGSFNPEWWESQIRQGKARKPPYFLGFFSKLRVTRERTLLNVQIAIGLRPANMELNEVSDPLELHEMQLPYPASIKGIDYAPVALIHLIGDSEVLDSQDPQIPMKIKFGSFGEFRNGELTLREDPLWKRILDGTFTHDEKRVCDSLPRLKGNLIAQKSVKMDLNIRSLNFVIRPNEAKKYIPSANAITMEDVILAKKSIGLEGIATTVSKTKERIGLGKPPSPKFDVIRLESAELLNTIGFGEIERIAPLSGNIGDANKKFAESINDMIDENYNLLWTKAGVNIIDSMIPKFFGNW